MTAIKWLFKFCIYLAGTIGLLILCAYVTGFGYLVKGVRLTYLSGYNSANINDWNDFDTRTVGMGYKISPLPKSSEYNKISFSKSLTQMLEDTRTTSFLVLRNDSIISESYYLGHTDTTRSNSFSMAKTITTMLVEKAIEEGLIKNWDEKVVSFLPWLKGSFAKELTLLHLSTMTSGSDWYESYKNPLGITARAYYGNDIVATMHKMRIDSKPGVTYKYQSGNTQLLGLCLKAAIGKPIAEYASEKLWVPLGAEAAATWHTDDENGMELTYCCFNAITRDFARLGNMVLHQGHTYQSQFIDSMFFKQAINPVRVYWYGQSFWLGKSGTVNWQTMQGASGQYITIIPSKNIVIVRTGYKLKKNPNQKINTCVQTYIDECIKIYANK
jgi:CubicO group peptidase (beta-lactamase class C family)